MLCNCLHCTPLLKASSPNLANRAAPCGSAVIIVILCHVSLLKSPRTVTAVVVTLYSWYLPTNNTGSMPDTGTIGYSTDTGTYNGMAGFGVVKHYIGNRH